LDFTPGLASVRITAIIAAAGAGRRLGSSVPKQLLEIDGRSMLEHSVEAFAAHPGVTETIVVLPPDVAAAPPAWLTARAPRVRVVPGGARRQDSVANGFDAADAAADVLLIHDAARPFVTVDVISRVIDAAAAHGAAIAAVPVSDTVKRADVDRRTGGAIIVDTVPRDALYLAQTPQGFRRAVLADAVAVGRSGVEATDEAMLAERAGHAVRLVDGAASNVKITTAEDFEAASARLSRTGTARIGMGYDLHRLVPGRRLMIGGVEVPSELGAMGHSDADVVCHAITDALLGAASAGDIGQHFPDTDARWKDASSIDLLRRIVALVRARGFAIVNVDVVVVLERPKLGPHRSRIADTLAAALGVEPSSVGVKAKTNEGVDAVGRGEAIAAHAVALLRLRHNVD
jgi:2-C-methyl-D-erythritol 4-phosphate cytidylyltransferase/2-C-methyl-D-erythritol 2,4-cyclodiphosphate synthase